MAFQMAIRHLGVTMSETVTIELNELEVKWLKNAIRWNLDYSDKNNLKRNYNKLNKLSETVNEQTE